MKLSSIKTRLTEVSPFLGMLSNTSDYDITECTYLNET